MMQPPAWAERYVGIPFVDFGRDLTGCDCWGLVKIVLEERAQITLPVFAIDPYDSLRITDQIHAEQTSGRWVHIEQGQEAELDVVEVMAPTRTCAGWQYWPLHVGIVAGPGWMLHCEYQTGSLLSGFDRRVIGFWRHRGLIDAAA